MAFVKMISDPNDSQAGYHHSTYAAALADVGRPFFLPSCRGWLLKRQIPDSGQHDAMGCYPLFACQDWSRLADDLDNVEGDLVTVCLVTDPFCDVDLADLERGFRDVARPFKEHYVVNLGAAPESFVASSHRRNAMKALKRLTIEICSDPMRHLDEWVRLYRHLVEKHHITGLRRFSRASFERQLDVPGMVVYRALRGTETVGMTLWYRDLDNAYYHLGAANPQGYQEGAFFALFWRALESFSQQGVRRLTLGANAGTQSESSGLNRFKRGWSTDSRWVYFCGRIFDHRAYSELKKSRGYKGSSGDYFPAYRSGEFC